MGNETVRNLSYVTCNRLQQVQPQVRTRQKCKSQSCFRVSTTVLSSFHDYEMWPFFVASWQITKVYNRLKRVQSLKQYSTIVVQANFLTWNLLMTETARRPVFILVALKWIPVALGKQNNCVFVTDIFMVKTSNLTFPIQTIPLFFDPHTAWLHYPNTPLFDNKIYNLRAPNFF